MKYNIDPDNLPKHIAIVMDGNGRYAQNLGMPRTAGHKAGAETLRKITEFCGDLGIKYLTVYAFSTENWNRPLEEVSGIMKLLGWYLNSWKRILKGQDIKINILGDIEPLEDKLKNKIHEVVEKTKDNKTMTLNIALNYGGRDEIVKAAKKISEQVSNGDISLSDIDEELFSKYLYTKDQPDPELIIRPGKEKRISNFLIWQLAYSEFWYSEKFWPDFTGDDILEAIYEYQKRYRKFGGL